MSKVHPSVIKIIAKEIALGNTCYVRKSTQKIIVIDHSIEDVDLIAAQEKTQSELEKNIKKYVKVEKLTMENQLEIMKDFIEELPNRSVSKQLKNALKRSNPLRNFTEVVESDMELNQHWRNYNIEDYKRWVSNIIIDAYNY